MHPTTKKESVSVLELKAEKLLTPSEIAIAMGYEAAKVETQSGTLSKIVASWYRYRFEVEPSKGYRFSRFPQSLQQYRTNVYRDTPLVRDRIEAYMFKYGDIPASTQPPQKEEDR